jgi:hypothetical protein
MTMTCMTGKGGLHGQTDASEWRSPFTTHSLEEIQNAGKNRCCVPETFRHPGQSLRGMTKTARRIQQHGSQSRRVERINGGVKLTLDFCDQVHGKF